jgi:hypothetical protein
MDSLPERSCAHGEVLHPGMVTIVADSEPGTRLPPPANFKPQPISECIDEVLAPDAECYALNGAPCLLFADLDYAEDWSGTYVRELHPFLVAICGKSISAEEFWRLVREQHH